MNNHEPLHDNSSRTAVRLAAVIAMGILTLATASALIVGQSSSAHKHMSASAANGLMFSAFPITAPTVQWGLVTDTMRVVEYRLKNGQSLSELLQEQSLSAQQQQRLIEAASAVFDLRNLRPDKPFYLLIPRKASSASYIVYEPSIYEYLRFSLAGEPTVERIKRPTSSEIRTADGTIEASLWKTMVDKGYSYELTDKMEDALQWSVDFHHLQKGDRFQLVYEQYLVEGEEAGVGRVQAARYQSGDKIHYAIYYDKEEHKGYYNLNGEPMKSSFLKAPVKYSRISSHFSLRRLHPVLKYNRPHYGTDYAAPAGTPIMAVGDGVVTAASYNGGNGNFVKIRHDNVHETQYLHMQRFASGIRPGVRVQQGQVIGYVGSTGLATGPHVCFRFWKNGRQVNHLKLEMPPAKPLPASEMDNFRRLRDELVKRLEESGEQPAVSGKP